MDRRNFLSLTLAAPLLIQSLRTSRKKNTDPVATTRYIFSQAMKRAHAEHWNKKSIGELMGQLGMLLVGTPYVGGTLEGAGPEVCRIDLTGLDCVTFFENVLDMARVIKKKKNKYEDLIQEVTFTRYRGGVLGDYTSRLHYTSDWLINNVEKNVVRDINVTLNGIPFEKNLFFMSKNPKYYKPLQENPTMVQTMAGIESKLNATTLLYVPKEAIREIEPKLQTGDIVAIATSKDGLDYAHTGMIYVDAGQAKFLHASLTKKKVILDTTISEYVNNVRTHTGITVVRPVEVG